jgi:hypothetical protein
LHDGRNIGDQEGVFLDDAVSVSGLGCIYQVGLFSSPAFARKKVFPGVFSALLSLISLSIFNGWIKEEKLSL